ncbi:hypothetical protein OG866_19745 [Streptomyces sp. NBC_00663]|uniref:WD40 repeat domain-containing protein n=1 Tax=Streptomyces sp. NBC_00663 TaxID=2975801 RepID=UPI002E346C7D|nr:hypothetical protein [Streptomyces sp. NBC_00663]
MRGDGRISWKLPRIEFSPDGRTIATDTEDNTVALWDTGTHRRIGETPHSHTAQIKALTFSPDGSLLATASRDNTVRLWDVTSRQQIGEPLEGHSADVTGVGFGPAGKTIVSWGRP